MSMPLFLIFPHFPKYLNPQVRTRKLVKSFFYHPCPLKLASEGYIFLYFFKLLRVFSLRMLIEFSLTCIFQHVWEKFFNLWCSHPSKIIESMLFYSCLSPPLKTPGRIFWKSVSPKTEGVGGSSVKIQSENMKMNSNISLFPFGMIANFLNLMTLQLCKQYQILWY